MVCEVLNFMTNSISSLLSQLVTEANTREEKKVKKKWENQFYLLRLGNKFYGIFCFIGLDLNYQVKDILSIWLIHRMWFVTLNSKLEDIG